MGGGGWGGRREVERQAGRQAETESKSNPKHNQPKPGHARTGGQS